MLTNFFFSPILNRPLGTSRALSRKKQNMTCVPSTIVLWRHDTDASVNQNKNAGSGGDGEDDPTIQGYFYANLVSLGCIVHFVLALAEVFV
jgi:hypothetical protein